MKAWMKSRLCVGHIAVFAALLFLALPAPSLSGQRSEFRSPPWRPKKVVVLPFEYIHNEIVLKLSLNGGSPANFLFDTGTDHMSLDRKAVEEGHLRTIPVNGKLVGLAGYCPISTVAQKVRIRTDNSNALLLRGSAPVIDLSGIEKSVGIPLAGIFGFDYLRQFPVLLDYRAKTITIFTNKKVQYRRAGIPIPVVNTDASEKLPHLPVIVAQLELPDGSQADAKLELDTGSDDTLYLNAPFLRNHHVAWHETKSNPAPAPIFTHAFCDKFEEVHADVTAILLGGLRFANPDTRYAKNPAGFSASDEMDGRLGNKFLSQFRIFFDIPRHQIVFEPSPEQ